MRRGVYTSTTPITDTSNPFSTRLAQPFQKWSIPAVAFPLSGRNEQSMTHSNRLLGAVAIVTNSTVKGRNSNAFSKCRRYVFSFSSLYRLKFVKLTLPQTTRIVENNVTKNVTCGLRKRPLWSVGSVQWLPSLFIRCFVDIGTLSDG